VLTREATTGARFTPGAPASKPNLFTPGVTDPPWFRVSQKLLCMWLLHAQVGQPSWRAEPESDKQCRIKTLEALVHSEK